MVMALVQFKTQKKKKKNGDFIMKWNESYTGKIWREKFGGLVGRIWLTNIYSCPEKLGRF